MEIYVGNLPWSVSDQELADAFGAYGNVEKASIISDRQSGRSKGFGFVTMNDDDAKVQPLAPPLPLCPQQGLEVVRGALS